MLKTTMKLSLLTAVLATLVSPINASYASDFQATLSQSNNLSRAGETLTVSISGLPDNQGLYILQCVVAASADVRPTVCVGQQSTIWTSKNAAMVGYGATPFTGTLNIPVTRTFTAANNSVVNCDEVSCGVFIRKDHTAPTDKTADTFLPITFAQTYDVSASKTTEIQPAGDNINVTLKGLTYNQGVYVRLCASAGEGVRPTSCDGQGIWASLDATQIALHATDASTVLALPVKAQFISGGANINCNTVACGIFVRRDHLGSGDLSLDKFIPLTFKAQPVITAKAKKTGSNFVLTITNAKGVQVRVTVGTVTKTVVPTSDNYSFTTAVGKNKGKLTKLKAVVGSNVLIDTKVKG